MANPYASPATTSAANPVERGRFLQRVIRLLIVYLALSIATLPFIDWWWIGEVPVLALFQIPKLNAALWLRRNFVMPIIQFFGLSQGSFSPDWIMAGPHALLFTYLVPLVILLGIVWWRTRMSPPHGRLALVLLAVCVIDFAFVMYFARGPGLSIY